MAKLHRPVSMISCDLRQAVIFGTNSHVYTAALIQFRQRRIQVACMSLLTLCNSVVVISFSEGLCDCRYPMVIARVRLARCGQAMAYIPQDMVARDLRNVCVVSSVRDNIDKYSHFLLRPAVHPNL